MVHGSEFFFSASEVASTVAGRGGGEKGFRFWQVDQVKLLLVLVPRSELRNGAEFAAMLLRRRSAFASESASLLFVASAAQ